MKINISKWLIIALPAIVFLFIGVITLPDYGINWDEPYHFQRGQAFFHYFLTGKKDFNDLPDYPYFSSECIESRYGCDGPPGAAFDVKKFDGSYEIYERLINKRMSTFRTRRSSFQSDYYTFDYFTKNDFAGHPPANDVLAAFTNYIFYQKLGWLGDIESYHLFEVFIVFLLIVGVSIFTYIEFGPIASLVASISLAAHPLVFSESHFNIKDPVEMSFYGLAIIIFYFAFKKKSWRLLITSAISAGLALGTKFNIIFVPFIVLPWLLFNFRAFKKILMFLGVYLIIVLAVFFIFWPILWENPIEKLKLVIDFYWTNATTVLPEVEGYLFKGFNLFPVTWILITTPISVLFLSFGGLLISLLGLIRNKKDIYLLLLLWLMVPIARVSLSATAIHSGVRHIMEFIPAMAILVGVSAKFLYEYSKRKFTKVLTILLLAFSFGFNLYELVRIHPNENVYFNQLIRGLPGAREKNIPFWGNSYGNAYFQGVEWLNQNAEPDSKLTLLLGAAINIPRQKLRTDIRFHNKYWSGPLNEGEYAMEMSHNYNQKSYFRYAYYDTFLNPVYEVRTEGVPILKVWKNSLEFVKEEFREKVSVELLSQELTAGRVEIDLGKVIKLTKINIKHGISECQKQKEGYIMISTDRVTWNRGPDLIDVPQSQPEVSPEKIGFTDANFAFYFIGDEARYIMVNTDLTNPCLLQDPEIAVYGLKSRE